jgi:cyclic lactone autoinducer peptide
MVDMSNRGQSYVKEGEEMHNIKRKVAKGVVKMLDKVLRIEANTCSSLITYDLKIPKDLQNYRRMR